LSTDPTQLRLKPTYNVSNFGESLILEIGTEFAAMQTITPSTADFGQVLQNANVPIEDNSVVISDVDTIGLVNLGDDTNYDQTYQFIPEISSILYKINFAMALGLNLSAWTSGTATIDSVQVIITEQDPNTPVEILNEVIDAIGLVALGAIGTQILLLNSQFPIDGKKIKGGIPISIRIIINTTQDLVNTRQVGIIPFFCYQAEAIAKRFSTSVIKLDIRPSLDSAFLVLRTEDDQELLDYSGIPFGGVIG